MSKSDRCKIKTYASSRFASGGPPAVMDSKIRLRSLAPHAAGRTAAEVRWPRPTWGLSCFILDQLKRSLTAVFELREHRIRLLFFGSGQYAFGEVAHQLGFGRERQQFRRRDRLAAVEGQNVVVNRFHLPWRDFRFYPIGIERDLAFTRFAKFFWNSRGRF
jgi:hypothetical protein